MQGMTLAFMTVSEKKHFKSIHDVNNDDNHRSAKVTSRELGHNGCLKSMSRTITMQGLTLTAITATEIGTLMLDRLDVKS